MKIDGGKNIESTSGRLRLVIDKNTGSIVRIEDRKTSVIHLNSMGEGRDDGRLFRIIVPSSMWSSRYADSQDAPSPNIQDDANSINIIYPELLARGEVTGVSAMVRIELASETYEARFTLKLENHGTAPITEVIFPIIGGWTGIGGKGKDKMILGAWTEFNPYSFPRNVGTTYARWHQRRFFRYPFDLYAPWVDLSGPGGGISYINYMDRPFNGGVYLENLAGYNPGMRLAFGWTHWPLIKNGETWTSPPVAVSLHEGDWRDTADKYNTWVDTWFSPAPGRRSARASIGFQNVFLHGFDGTPIRGLESIPEIARVGRKYGVDQLCVWDFLILGNYTKHADLDILNFNDVEKEILRKGLHQAKKEGTDVSALINFRITNPMSTLYKKESHAELIRSLDGSLRTESYPASHYHAQFFPIHVGPISYVLSPRSESYRRRVLRQVQEYIDLGFTSMFYDQPFEVHPDYNLKHKNASPDDVYEGCLELIAKVRKMLSENDPNSLMIGEACEVFASQSIDLWMSWYTGFKPLERIAYAFPYTMNSWVVDSNIAEASRAFALGLYLCLTTHGVEETLDAEPALGEHVRKLAALRKRCAQRTCFARFRHTCGLDLDLDDGVSAYAYNSTEGPAVIIAAGERGGSGKIEVDPNSFTTPGTKGPGTIFHLDGSQENISKPAKLPVKLKPNEVVIWYC